MLTQQEFTRNIRVLIFKYKKKPSFSQINLLLNTELGVLLNELNVQQRQTLKEAAFGVEWGEIAKEVGVSIKKVQLEYQLACRHICKRILEYSESVGFENKRFLSKERVAFMRNKFAHLSGYSLRGIPIEALGLSSETYTTLAFKMEDIRTLAQVQMLDMYNLSRIKGVGDKTIEELRYIIEAWK